MFEIVWGSGDKTEKDYSDYFAEMPWLALPFKDPSLVSLIKKFEVKGVPRLVVLNVNGEILHENAVHKIKTEGPDAISDFVAGKKFGNQPAPSRSVEPQRELVNELIENNPVVVFSKTTCPFCKEAKEILERGGVKFLAKEIDTDPQGADIQEALRQLTG